jgi:Ca-activated chloride channel family protein
VWVLDRPVYLLFLLVLPVLFYLRHVRPSRGGRLVVPFSVSDAITFHPPVTFRVFVIRLTTAMFWAGLILLVLALSGPTRTERERVYLSRGIDIMLVVDQSASMAAQDFRPVNRFETARSVIRRFVEQRPNDHIGLVGFSAEAALRSPPTLNYDHLLRSLDSMELMELGDGTAIGMGLALASLHLQGSEATERVIVLLTDGVNNAGEISPEAAAEVAGEAGIRIYAIGVGSGQEARIEVRDPETGELYRGTVRDSYDQETLEAIAELSDGNYFTAGSAGTLEQIFDAIGTAENTERRVQIRVTRFPLHRPFLIWALALLIADVLIRRFLLGSTP